MTNGVRPVGCGLLGAYITRSKLVSILADNLAAGISRTAGGNDPDNQIITPSIRMRINLPQGLVSIAKRQAAFL